MLLIDASNIGGGGAVLLQYLAQRLRQRSLEHFILVSPRAGVGASDHRILAGATPISRRRRVALGQLVSDVRPHRVLCFGNVPPPFPIRGAKVLTYFHNALLIPGFAANRFDLRSQVAYRILRLCIRRFGSHTDEWLFQTEYVRDLFQSSLAADGFRAGIYPFFPPPKVTRQEVVEIDSDFVFVSNYSLQKNHANLLRAMIVCAQRGAFPKLVLTIDENCDSVISRLGAECRSLGANVVFEGSVSHKRAIELTKLSRFAIFPSLIETLGLGAIEAIANGKQLLISDRPWAKAVCKSSLSFDPLSPESIADAMLTALTSPALPQSQVKVQDRVDEFIDYLCLP